MIEGPIFAILTPFDSNGHIDEGALRDYLQFLYDRGVRSIVAGGTTGEFPSLDMEERTNLFQLARNHFSGRVINNISSCSFKTAREFIHRSEGADALLILPPYYFKGVPNDGIVSFVRESMKDVGIPTFLYHFPRHTQFHFTADMVKEICETCPNIIGIKDSGGDFNISLEFRDVAENFQVFIGRDSSALKALEAGLAGSVSGASNPFPEYLVGLAEAWRNGEYENAEVIQKNFNVWNAFRSNFKSDEIAMAKYALSLRLPGFPTDVRPPLVNFCELHKNKLKTFIEQNTPCLA